MPNFYEMLAIMEEAGLFGSRPRLAPQQKTPTEEIKRLLGSNYETFVKRLDANIEDPRFLDAVRAMVRMGSKIKPRDIAVRCEELRPTQNEVVLDKSLSFSLKKPRSVEAALSASSPVTVAGKPIVTSNGGRFVIDGHHRWSELYCMNPEAEIAAVDIGDLGTPEQALKSVQIGIAATIGDVPTASGGGINLFQIDEGTLTNYVASAMTDEVVEVFKRMRPEMFSEKNEQWSPPDRGQKNLDFRHDQSVAAIAKYVWENVRQLQSKARPVAPAPDREVMPQTDDAGEGWKTNTVPVRQIAAVAAGASRQMNLAAHTSHQGELVREWVALSGLKEETR